MRKTLLQISKRLNALVATTLLLMAQLVVPMGLFVGTASAVVNECVVDTAGANDEPGQKDLTKLCVNDHTASPRLRNRLGLILVACTKCLLVLRGR